MMKYCIFMFCFLCAICTAYCQESQPYIFPSEKLTFDAQHIYVISDFEEVSFLTAYTYSGDIAWEVNFNSQIVSCKRQKDGIFIFSKDRHGSVYYLTHIDSSQGKLIWEKPIWAPEN